MKNIKNIKKYVFKIYLIVIILYLLFFKNIINLNIGLLLIPLAIWMFIEMNITFIKEKEFDLEKFYNSIWFMLSIIILILINLLYGLLTGNLTGISGIRGISINLNELPILQIVIYYLINIHVMFLLILRLVRIFKIKGEKSVK